jgi:hypothetical protein
MNEQRDLFGARVGEYELPPHVQLGTCHSCQAPVVWTRTKKDRPVPLSVATIEERDGIRYALSHFADCPDAKKWSKRY